MRQIGTAQNPYTLRNEAQKLENERLRRRAKRQHARERVQAYLSAAHTYELVRGDMWTGRCKVMLGSEARDANHALEDKFHRALGADPKARLWRWRLKKEAPV